MDYLEQKKEVINGITYNYLCHIENIKKIGNVYPAHYHNYIEILYCISGVYTVTLNGRHYEFSDGDMTLINSKEVHKIDAKEIGQYIVLRFEPEIIYNNMFENYLELKYVFPFIWDNPKQQKVIKKEEIKDSFVPKLLYEMIREFEEKIYGYELAIQNDISRIFLWILRYFYRLGTNFTIYSYTHDAMMKCLKPCLDYILEHYNAELKASDMAILCNMSYSYFSRIFNSNMKMGFNEYLNYIRVMEAEKLLISTNMNITEVAYAVGFSTTSYFIKIFGKYKHTSPKQFKKEFTLAINNS